MKKSVIGSLMIAGLCAATVACTTSPDKHWDYEGAKGPDNWEKLSPDYGLCGSGKNQSPIDLKDMLDYNLPDIAFDYRPGVDKILDNGHTLRVDYKPGSSIALDGRTFQLAQIHFHAPSEHRIGGKSYPMEIHLVHADENGNLAVIGAVVKEGMKNKALERILENIPKSPGTPIALETNENANAFLPAKRDYYRYNGSLTTPPCSEGVLWLVMKYAVRASKDQLGRFAEAMGPHSNNRPTRPLNARVILK